MFLIHLSKNREEKKNLKMLSEQDVKKNYLLALW